MKRALTAEQQRFREDVETFLDDRLDPAVAAEVRRGKPVGRDALNAWTAILNERGWAAPSWPKAFGGPGWTLLQRHLFDVACRLAHAPVLSGMNFNMVGPAIIRFGTPEQQAEHLPKILSGERWWCQGYSEPGAGSDLASLRTTAVRDGDDYIVSGQKTWTTGAESADWIFCLVRTDPHVQQQRGITFLLIDMASPGVRRQPLYAFNGKALWNQVFFDEVRVPAANRLGAENEGWTVAKSLLGDERLFVSRVAENKRCLSVVRELLESWPGVEALRAKADALELRLQALEATSLRILAAADAGGRIGAEPSMLKLKGSQLVQAMDELLVEVAGLWSLPADATFGAPHAYPGPSDAEYLASGAFHHRGYTIAGGTTEVQRNIIAKQVLGL